ncbi:hypothetical protein KY285_019685 [Solanum tuberosum]|nr:hypothetical protein KY285_019685 [Solanum tuberosum]
MSKDVVILETPSIEGIQYSKLIHIDSCWVDLLTEIKWIYKKFFILVTRIRDLWLIVKGFYISSHLFSEKLKTLNKDIYDQYSTCGPYVVCYDEDLPCRCPDGFIDASLDGWNNS